MTEPLPADAPAVHDVELCGLKGGLAFETTTVVGQEVEIVYLDVVDGRALPRAQSGGDSVVPPRRPPQPHRRNCSPGRRQAAISVTDLARDGRAPPHSSSRLRMPHSQAQNGKAELGRHSSGTISW